MSKRHLPPWAPILPAYQVEVPAKCGDGRVAMAASPLYPGDWHQFSEGFVTSPGIQWNNALQISRTFIAAV